jgi:hypothetical protein
MRARFPGSRRPAGKRTWKKWLMDDTVSTESYMEFENELE